MMIKRLIVSPTLNEITVKVRVKVRVSVRARVDDLSIMIKS
jgi:hypothetical protein